jgi:hypothetical protein
MMLNCHSRLHVPFESNFIPDFYDRLDTYGDLRLRPNRARLLADIARQPFVVMGGLLDDPEAILSTPAVTYPGLVRAIFDRHAGLAGKARWGDKTPVYIDALDTLWGLFPGCKIIHLIRDGRDVALSHRKLKWEAHLPTLAERWRRQTLTARQVGNVLGEAYLEIHYEALVTNPEVPLRRICAFLDEPYEAGMLDYATAVPRDMPAAAMKWHPRLASTLDASGVGAWRRDLSRADRIIFEGIAGPALEVFGYELEHGASSLASLAKGHYYWTMAWWRQTVWRCRKLTPSQGERWSRRTAAPLGLGPAKKQS